MTEIEKTNHCPRAGNHPEKAGTVQAQENHAQL
jgi:hypothetical protein